MTTTPSFSDTALDEAAAVPPAAAGHLLAWLVLGNLLLLSLFIGLSVLSLQWSLQSQVARTDVATTNLARTLQQNISSTIDKLDLALSLAGHTYEERLHQGPAQAFDVDQLLAGHQRLLGEGEGMRIADAEGVVRHGTDLPPGRTINVADRDYFAQARSASARHLIISEPLQSRISGRWVIVLARRLTCPMAASPAWSTPPCRPRTSSSCSPGWTSASTAP